VKKEKGIDAGRSLLFFGCGLFYSPCFSVSIAGFGLFYSPIYISVGVLVMKERPHQGVVGQREFNGLNGRSGHGFF